MRIDLSNSVILSSISNKNVIFLPLGEKVRMMGELEHVKLDFPFQSGTINPLSFDSAEQNNPVNCFVRGLGVGERV